MNTDEKYMRRCLELAQNGKGTTFPNPMVGAVIVHNDKIIGEGWHRKAGEPHAEIMAIESVQDKSLLKESTLYVNLEPCSHQGRTPACSLAIIEHGIPKVVISHTDPNPLVSGKGVEMLQEAGVEVVSGVLEKEAMELNRFFIKYHRKKHPYIVLKWAQSADRILTPFNASRFAISNAYSRTLMHKWRSEIPAIMIGLNTLMVDNPRLDSRLWNEKAPLPVILGGPHDFEPYQVFDIHEKVLVFSEEHIENPPKNVKVFRDTVLREILDQLYEQEILAVMVEGGANVLEQFIETGLWDEARIFTSKVTLGEGLKAPSLEDEVWLKASEIEGDKLDIYRHRQNHLLQDGVYL